MSRLKNVVAALFGISQALDQVPAVSNDNQTTTNLTIEELSKLYNGGGLESFAGRNVTEKSAMCVSTVYACVALIGGALSTCAATIYERTADGRSKADHPYYWILNERPCPSMSAAVFWEYLAGSVMLHGDGFAQIMRAHFRTNEITALVPLHPSRVQVYALDDGELTYYITPEGGSPYWLTANDMLHIPGLGFDGKRGMSVIQYCAKQAVGTALAAEEYSARFFGNGARPDFVLQTDQPKLTPEAAEVLKLSFLDRHQGVARSHLPAVLTGGLKVQQLTMTSEDAQLILTRGFQVEDICRFFGVPPHMVGHMEKTSAWGTGVEQIGRGFVKFTLSRLLGKIEQEFNNKAWPVRQKYFLEFNVAGLERGDLKSENESLRIALGRAGEPGWMSQDEVRRIKNLPPKGGDADNLNDGKSTAPAKPDSTPTDSAKETPDEAQSNSAVA